MQRTASDSSIREKKRNKTRSAHSQNSHQSRSRSNRRKRHKKQDSMKNLLSIEERASLNPAYHSGDSDRMNDIRSRNSSVGIAQTYPPRSGVVIQKSAQKRLQPLRQSNSSSIRNTGSAVRHHHLLQASASEWPATSDNQLSKGAA